MALPSDLPKSPWLEHLDDGNIKAKIRNGVHHSCFAPEFPDLHPNTWLDIPPPPTPPPSPPPLGQEQSAFGQLQGLVPHQPEQRQDHERKQDQQFPLRLFTPPTNEDCDRVFFDEEAQKYLTYGLRTWECAGMNSIVWDGVAGQVSGDVIADSVEGRNVEARTRIEVDETKWLPFLQKDKWYDWIQTSPPGPPGQDEGKLWSIDDPQIWEVMKTPLELVDRMIKALIRDKHEWMECLLYGRMVYWRDAVPAAMNFPEPYPHARLLLGREMDQLIATRGGEPTAVDWDLVSSFNDTEWTNRLNNLLYRHIMSFAWLDGVDAHACDINQEADEYTSICHISTSRVSVLMNKDLTLAAKTLLEFQLAVTILHEYIHAIHTARKRLDTVEQGNCIDLVDPNRMGEAIHDCFGIAELGFTMEQRVFGGELDLRPTANGIPLVMVATRIPNRVRALNEFVPGPWMTAPLDVHHIPTLWASKMFSEAFWRDQSTPRKSDNFFHKNAIFKSVESYQNQLGFHVVTITDPNFLPHAYPEDHLALETWNARHQLWAGYRANWYEQERYDWLMSPWSYWSYRNKLDMFAVAFKRRDQYVCAEIAQLMLNILPWGKPLEEYQLQLPTNDDPNPKWVFHMIGLLMSASIPVRVTAISLTTTSGPEWSFTGFPSKSADAAGETARVYVHTGYTKTVEKFAVETSCYNPFRGLSIDQSKADEIDQADFIDAAQDVFSHVTTRCLSYRSWNQELGETLKRVTAERKRLEADYPNSYQQHWSREWRFDCPVYKKGVVRWDGSEFVDVMLDMQTGQWRKVQEDEA